MKTEITKTKVIAVKRSTDIRDALTDFVENQRSATFGQFLGGVVPNGTLCAEDFGK